MRHLNARWFIATLGVKSYIVLGAVENGLATAKTNGDRVQGLDHLQAKAFGPVVLGDHNFLNVADHAPIMDTEDSR